MSGVETVLVRFLLPMIVLLVVGLVAMHYVGKAAAKRTTALERPLPLRLLVALWALEVGAALFEGGQVLFAAVTGQATPPISSESWAWFGADLLGTAVLVAACYALFELRRSALRLVVAYVLLTLLLKAAYCIVHPEFAAMWVSGGMAIHVLLSAVTIGYVWHLRSNGLLGGGTGSSSHAMSGGRQTA